MSLEIEAQFRVESHEAVRQRLWALGAGPLGEIIESNLILDRPGGTLRRAGQGLRIRSVSTAEGWEGATTLTFKGPQQAGPFKSREELEVEISSAEVTAEILGLLGYVCILSYQKRRESWSLGPCRVELDEPPHIGLFVEIEGPDEAAVWAAQVDLGLADLEHTPESYVRLLADYCNRHGIVDRLLDLPPDSEPPLG